MVQNESNHTMAVSEATRRGVDIQHRWDWVEGSVWTGRMLAALERGIDGGRWYSLIDKVWKPANLACALTTVVRNQGGAGVDGQQVAELKDRGSELVARLSRQLQEGRYEPLPVRRVWMPKPGSKELRPLGIPTVLDRVVQTALRNVLEPIFEYEFADHSYGFRPGRQAAQALRRVDQLLHEGYTWIVDADLKGYFDSIPQDLLLAQVARRVSDGAILELLQKFLQQGVMDSAQGWQPTEKGTPQGAVISPLLANLYLDPLDHLMVQQGFQMVRYADDFVLLCRSQEEAHRALAVVKAWTETARLTLHPDKTRLVDAREPGGFDFLGYHFERGHCWPRDKSVRKLKDVLKAKTRRTDGRCLTRIVADVNRTLQGWNAYFHHHVDNVGRSLNGWLRQRLRAILKRRTHRPGVPKGLDFQRWPNGFFERLGLHSIRGSPQRLLPIPEAGF